MEEFLHDVLTLWGFLVLKWSVLWMVVGLIVAGLIVAWTRWRPVLRSLGVLAMSYVLYHGYDWNAWWWLDLFFNIAWWLLFIAGIASLIIYGWRARTYRVWGVVQGLEREPIWSRILNAQVIILLVAMMFLYTIAFLTRMDWPVGDEPAHTRAAIKDVDESADELTPPGSSPSPTASSAGPSASPSPSPTSAEPSESNSPGPTTGATDHNDVCAIWPMYDGTPTTSIWIIKLAITNAHTSRQAFQAFKYGWYDWALNHTVILSQLAQAIGVEVPAASELSDNGCATTETQDLVDSLLVELQHASYYPVPGAVRVVLVNGNTFRVMADTGQVQPN